MPIPNASQLAAQLQGEQWLRANYGNLAPAAIPGGPGALAPLNTVVSDIKPNEAQLIAAERTLPVGSPGYTPPDALMQGIDTSGVVPGVTGRTGRTGTATAAAPPSTAPVTPTAVAQPISASAISSGLTATPNYYLSGSQVVVPQQPVSYGTATGGMAPAGTVTPSGNVVGTNAPAAGTPGGGGAPPKAPNTAMQGMLAQTALSSLSGAASSYAKSQAIPDPTMAAVQPTLAEFPIIQLQQKAAPLG